MSENKNRVRVGISCGDLNGIGLEVVIKSLQDNRLFDQITPILYANSATSKSYRRLNNINDFSFEPIPNADAANLKKANIIDVWDEEANINLGTPDKTIGEFAFKSLEAATKDLASNKIDVLVTAPINKDTIQASSFKFPGHTEYLAEMSNTESYLMMLVSGGLRVGVVTGHIPLKEVAEKLTTKDIVQKIEIMADSLTKDFGIHKPKIAVLGLNPHAGDNGLLGDEEKNIIQPAIKECKNSGHYVFGPYASDGFFGSSSFQKYDGIIAMYHDQGLAPFKALSFGTGVNFTAGLPIVRTSPDHGTGFDIAGKNLANEMSFRNAIYTAVDIFKNRKIHREITSNPLAISAKKEGRRDRN